MSDTAILALQILTALSSFIVTLSPSPAIVKILRTKSVASVSIFPLVALLANSHMWMLYGYFRGNIFPVVVSFGFGDIAAIAYLVIYYRFADDGKYVRVMIACGAVPVAAASIYAVVAAMGATGQSDEQISRVMGCLGIVAAVFLYGAPFEKIVRVLRTKSAAGVQIVMVVCGATNNLLWVLYTSLDSSWFMFIPNVICLPLGLVMLVLYVIYRPGRAVQPSIELPDGDLAITIELSPKSEHLPKLHAQSPMYTPMASPLAPLTGSGRGHSPKLTLTAFESIDTFELQ